MDVSAFFAPPDIMTAKRALCIQPHADDNEIGMGGTIAALAAKGTSRATGIEIINRGYEKFMEKLEGLGADVSLSEQQASLQLI